MERILVGDEGSGRVRHLREFVARVGVGQVVDHPVTAVQVATPLQRGDVTSPVVRQHLVETVGVGGEVGAFHIVGCCQPAQVVVGELVATFHGFVSQLFQGKTRPSRGRQVVNYSN